MHDGPNVLGRLRDFYDGIGGGKDFDDGEAVEPRRALIPDYEVYEPPSRWVEDVQFVAFIVMLCLAVLLVLTGLRDCRRPLRRPLVLEHPDHCWCGDWAQFHARLARRTHSLG